MKFIAITALVVSLLASLVGQILEVNTNAELRQKNEKLAIELSYTQHDLAACRGTMTFQSIKPSPVPPGPGSPVQAGAQ